MTTETETLGRGTLLDELDSRQNEILDQLDALNLRVEQLLRDWSSEQVLGGEMLVGRDVAVC